METVTISPRFQAVIPIEFLSVRPARELRGLLRGLDTRIMRDESDRV